MEKKHLISGILFAGVGVLFVILACRAQELQSTFSGFAGAGLGIGITMIVKYFYWSRPTHQERYREKMSNMKILLQDERSEALRCRAGYYMYLGTLVFLGFAVAVLQILENKGTLHGVRWMVIFLGVLFFAELILGWLLYRWLEKKY